MRVYGNYQGSCNNLELAIATELLALQDPEIKRGCDHWNMQKRSQKVFSPLVNPLARGSDLQLGGILNLKRLIRKVKISQPHSPVSLPTPARGPTRGKGSPVDLAHISQLPGAESAEKQMERKSRGINRRYPQLHRLKKKKKGKDKIRKDIPCLLSSFPENPPDSSRSLDVPVSELLKEQRPQCLWHTGRGERVVARVRTSSTVPHMIRRPR